MARNRKYQSAAIRFGPSIKAFLLCLLIGGSGVGYVWQKSRIDQLGQQLKQREVRLTEIQRENEKLSRQLALMRTPRFLEEQIRKLNLGLVPPQPNQVWHLPEPARDWPGLPREQQQYALEAGSATSVPQP